MKYIILMLISFNTLAIEKDKKLHTAFSFVISGTVTGISENAKLGFTSCMIVGTGKELLDEVSYGGFDTKDLMHDALGCGLGSYLVIKTFKSYEIKPYTFDNGSNGFGFQYKIRFWNTN